MNRILLLAKDSSEIQLIERALRVDGHVLRSEHDVAGCLSALDQWKPTLFLADLSTGMSISSLTQLSAEMKIRDVKLMVLAAITILDKNQDILDDAVNDIEDSNKKLEKILEKIEKNL